MPHTIKKDFSFTRISDFENGCITGPMSPILFAREMAKFYDQPLTAVYSIDFGTLPCVSAYQVYEKGEGWTGYGQFLICFPAAVSFWVDEGINGRCIAALTGVERNPIINELNNVKYKHRLNSEQLTRLIREGYTLAMEYKNNQLKPQLKAFQELQKTG